MKKDALASLLDVDLGDEGDADYGGDDGGELPEEFIMAADEFLDSNATLKERRQALYDAIMACQGGGVLAIGIGEGDEE